MVINPWRALRAAREQLTLERIQAAEAANIRSQRVEAAERSARLAEVELSATRKMLEATAQGLAEATKKNAALTKIIAKGHFRNPETGRIGPVGKVYE